MNEVAPATIEYSAPNTRGSAWTQTVALLVDAYRDLQARKLFWLTLLLSLIVAVAFGFVGIDQNGITIFGKSFPGAWNSSIIPPAQFYKFLFTSLAIPFWLGFLAAVLGLVAVGGIFPEMISGGSIDLYLSRPIGRLRLFATKYLFGLLFIAAQVLLFSTASFIIIGVRGGSWEPRIFLAVPLVTVFFSYLYGVCVLIGIVTRSTLASILLTLLFWAGLWAVHNTDMVLTTFSAAADARVEQQHKLIAFNQEMIDKNQASGGNASQWIFQRDSQKLKLADYEQTARDLRWWQRLILTVKTPLPKTAETVDLMSRWLINPDPFQQAEQESREHREQRREQRREERGIPSTRENNEHLGMFAQTPEAQQRIAEEINARKAIWIIGTSVGFELVVLALASWIFCRRDY